MTIKVVIIIDLITVDMIKTTMYMKAKPDLTIETTKTMIIKGMMNIEVDAETILMIDLGVDK